MNDTIKLYLNYIKIYSLGFMSALTLVAFFVLVWYKYELNTNPYFIKAEKIIKERKVTNES
jgi:hypothetical protein